MSSVRTLGDAVSSGRARAARGDGLRDALTDPLSTPGRPPALQFTGAVSAPADAHAVALDGVSGAGAPLPHHDAIQASFGSHDVSGVGAHVGGAARDANARLGARAFATGDQVAFGEAPDLHTAAHEAAHVVQQRSGVHLKSGVGERGDVHERHADAVADRVVRGESAQDLLDAYDGAGGGPSGAVQFDELDEITAMPARKKHADEFLMTVRRGCGNKLVKKLIGEALAGLEELRKGMNGQYAEAQWFGFIDEERKLTSGGKNSLLKQAGAIYAVHKDMTTKAEGSGDAIREIESVVTQEIGAAARSFATPEQLEAARLAKEALAPILKGHKDRLAPLSQAKTTLESTEGAPTPEDVGTAKEAVTAFDQTDAPADHGEHVGALKSVLQDLSKTGLRAKMKAMYLAAVNDPAKQLDADDSACAGYAANMDGKTKTEVEQDIEARLSTQHEPDKGAWLEVMGLDTPAKNLWLKASVGDIDGTNVHASLFKDNVPAKASVKTAVGTLKSDLLGSGTSGFHVTLEHFGPHGGGIGQNNPHAYRGGADRQNDYPTAPADKSPWATVRGKLGNLRDEAVRDAETKITSFKDVLGRRRFK